MRTNAHERALTVRDGAHPRQRVEGKLVVQMVEDADGEKVSVEGCRASEFLDRGLRTGLEGRAFHDRRERGAYEQGYDSRVSVQRGAAEVLHGLHRLLR